MAEPDHAPGDFDPDARDRNAPPSERRVRLPRKRNSSPWTRPLIVVTIVVLVLVTPLWLDPWTLDELFGGGRATATPTVLATPAPSPQVLQ